MPPPSPGRGRLVLGFDRSTVGSCATPPGAWRRRVSPSGRALSSAGFEDPAGLSELLTEVLGQAEGPVLFYLRFVLQSLSQEVQDGLLEVIGRLARAGDVVAAEFRTEEDRDRRKAHGPHCPPVPERDDVSRHPPGPVRVRAGAGSREGLGLSPLRREDPALYRLVARRR